MTANTESAMNRLDGPPRTTQLRALLESPALEFILEAHNGISARIAEETGFKGIWASGLALSAQFGVRDNNEASWTQIVEMLEFMSDVTHIPILLDGDTGYGNFNNMRRLVRKLEQRGIAGVCIEDKLFPKSNSFISGERQPLADIEEFCGKIAAGKDSQTDDDFCIVARIEALIAGWDVGEALLRAEAYRQAGADAVLVHSKLSRPDQILEFCDEWDNRAPVVVVPTKYYSTPTEVFRRARISLVIWANHMIRSAVDAMQRTARRIYDDQGLMDVEDRIASVDEIFRLQGADELREAEARYFSANRPETHAIVLAATRGDGLAGLTDDKPKVMVPIGGKPLLRRLVDKFKKQGVDQITVVAGYKADSIDVTGIHLVINDDHARSGELASLVCAMDRFSDDMIVSYGDLLFKGYILRGLIDSDAPLTIAVDSALDRSAISGAPDFAYCTEADDRSLWGQEVTLKRVSNAELDDGGTPDGRWIGMLRARGDGRRWLEDALTALTDTPEFPELGVPDLLNRLVEQGHTVRVLYINGHWLDVNSLPDLEKAGMFAAD
jgi:phosphoenolpyruvate phosphomutase